MSMKLWWRASWGSALIEAQAAEYALPLQIIPLDDSPQGVAAQEEWANLNPLQQLPTMQLDDGPVMTESAAITLWLAELTGSDALVPVIGSPQRAQFLRWLIWLVANIYPCVNLYDDPTSLVADPFEARGLQDRVSEQMKALWQQAAEFAGDPWFLGEQFSALDLMVAVMLRENPGLDWAAEHVPRLYHIATAAAERPAVAPVIARNFPEGPAN